MYGRISDINMIRHVSILEKIMPSIKQKMSCGSENHIIPKRILQFTDTSYMVGWQNQIRRNLELSSCLS